MSTDQVSDKTLYGPPLAEAEGIGALTLGGFLLEVCARYADNEALVFHDPLSRQRVSWTYADLQREATIFSKALIAAGLGKGGRVGILMGSRPECVAAIFGTALAGGVVAPFSTMATAEELSYLIRHADIEILISQTRLGEKHRPLDTVLAVCPQVEQAATGKLSVPAFPYLRSVVGLGLEASTGAVQSWQAFIDAGSVIGDDMVTARNDEVAPADAGLIIYSSGSTAMPKGMLHTQRAPTLQAWHQAGIFCRTQETRMWSTFPLFWTAGFNTVMGATLAAGACWVMEELFEPGEALALLAKERVTEPYALPHHTSALEEHSDWLSTDLSSVRNASMRMPFSRHPKVTTDPNWHGVWAYGASETCAISVSHRANTSPEISAASTGRVLPGNMLRIADANSGELLGPGDEGEICIKGPTLMDRYVKTDKEDCFDTDGFFHTGDSGYYDEDGYLHWTGRLTDMIKTAGANVSPAELQRVVQRVIPTLKISQFVGVPDDKLGQIVVLCVVLQDGDSKTEDEIKATLKQHVASYKVPRRVLFFNEDEVPMTGSGEKVKDAELREIAQQRLASE